MKTRSWKLVAGRWSAQSALECGGPLPLLNRSKDPALQSARGLAQSKTWRIFGALLTFFTIIISVHAQNYSIGWYKVAGGGGTSSGGTYQVSGTIGQPDASGALTGGNYSLTGGFWALISVVQTAGLPDLTIMFVGSNSVKVSWPNTGSYTLQQKNNLAALGGWSTSGYTITTANGTNSITVISPTGNLFFRLSNP